MVIMHAMAKRAVPIYRLADAIGQKKGRGTMETLAPSRSATVNATATVQARRVVHCLAAKGGAACPK